LHYWTEALRKRGRFTTFGPSERPKGGTPRKSELTTNWRFGRVRVTKPTERKMLLKVYWPLLKKKGAGRLKTQE